MPRFVSHARNAAAVALAALLVTACDKGGSDEKAKAAPPPTVAVAKAAREDLTKELVMTCRRFTPQEAKAIGFVNRVVPAAQLQNEAEHLAQELIAKPSVPVAITKEHVNSVARTMGAGMTGFADGDVLLGAIDDQESSAAARAYMEKTFGRGKKN